MGAQRDLGKGFRREVDDELEEVITPWIDLLAEEKELKERIKVAEEKVLTRMRARKRKVYEGPDGTIVSLELSAKVRAKRPKQAKDDAEDGEPEGELTVVSKPSRKRKSEVN